MAKSNLETLLTLLLQKVEEFRAETAQRISELEDRLEKVEGVAHEQATDETLFERYRKIMEEAKKQKRPIPKPWIDMLDELEREPLPPARPRFPYVRHEFDRDPMTIRLDPPRKLC